VHWYLWDTLIMLDILLIFLAWMHWMPRSDPPPDPRGEFHAT
jgi:hypothetical protein